ncbi:MAG TPA: M28 family peptidase [Candidatus Acidoferrum sp.]|nr:M28 family peptidase [Candidatus Acidoferrum sp.]
MRREGQSRVGGAVAALLLFFGLSGCKAKADASKPAAPFLSGVAMAPPAGSPLQSPEVPAADQAPPTDKTSGFDGNRAYAHVAKQVSFGPRPAGSAALAKTQDYLLSELKGYGCSTDVDSFTSDTPAGRISMKNILVKIPGQRAGIILLGTHYDTKQLPNFVGADDAGSSTGVMLELARLLCREKGRYAVWIAFFDGEEAVREQWQDPDNCYGSREMAARLALSGDLPRIKAFMLADIVGTRTPHFKRESYSTKWLVDLVWDTAKQLGYGNIFIEDSGAMEDDHQSFLKRKVPSMDVIDPEFGDGGDIFYWHTPEDTLDKISPKTLAIVGHVFLESVKQLQSRLHETVLPQNVAPHLSHRI